MKTLNKEFMMKPLQVYIDEKRLKSLKQEALDKNTTMAEIIRGYLDGTQAVILETQDDGDTNPAERIPLTNAEKLYNPNVKTCKHGYAVGLCKHGCVK